MPKTLEEARKYYYGRTFGMRDGKQPNFVEGRCIENVTYYVGRWPDHKQCSRKACVDGTWCKQHDPEFIKKKRAEENKRFHDEMEAQRRSFFLRNNAKKFYEALVQIADGHNDARGLAIETLKETGRIPE